MSKKEVGMNSSNEYNSAADLINSVYASIDTSKINDTNKFINSWENIISGIKPDGLKLAAHSKIIDLKNNVLLVETDHPGWTQLLQMRRKYILNGLKIKFPELKIHTIAFKLKSDHFEMRENLRETTFEAMDKVLDERLKDEDKNFESRIKNKQNTENCDISPDLKKRLDNLRESILTNS
jgi:hypothetical protein